MTLRREDLDGAIAVLTIDRPEARNALSPEIRGLFAEYCTSMAEDEAVRAVVITGAGDHFCAGGDVKTMGEPRSGRDAGTLLGDGPRRRDRHHLPETPGRGGAGARGGGGREHRLPRRCGRCRRHREVHGVVP